MIDITDYKEKRILELKNRLKEINNIIGLDTVFDIKDRNDSFAEKLKDKKIDTMKKYYEEMIEIKKEIAKLEGRKSIFEDI